MCTVQLRGKVTLVSESHACARAYTRECSSCHSRTFLERSRVLHSSLDCHTRVLDRCARHSRAAASPTPTAHAHAYTVRTLDSPRPQSLRATKLSAPSEPPRSLRASPRPLSRAPALSPSLPKVFSPRPLSADSTPPPHERKLACTSTHVLALALAEHPRVLGVLLARIQKTLACDSHLTRE